MAPLLLGLLVVVAGLVGWFVGGTIGFFVGALVDVVTGSDVAGQPGATVPASAWGFGLIGAILGAGGAVAGVGWRLGKRIG